MEQLKHTFCRYDMVCDNPKGNGVEIVKMPDFFYSKPELETSKTHVHPFYEIVWFQKGEGTHTVDFTQYPVSDNTVFFIAPGQVHSFDGHRSSEGLVMKICTHLLDNLASDDGVLLKYNVFSTYDSQPFKQITPACAEAVNALLSMLDKEIGRNNEIGHKNYMRSLITMMLLEIERCQLALNPPYFSTNRTAHRVFLSFRREIERNYNKMHTVKEYAELLNVGTKSLTNYVTECSTFSPLEMINNRIILEAKRMLRYSDMMVKEIAAELGFEDASYFNKFFKRLVKCSAAEYRTDE